MFDTNSCICIETLGTFSKREKINSVLNVFNQKPQSSAKSIISYQCTVKCNFNVYNDRMGVMLNEVFDEWHNTRSPSLVLYFILQCTIFLNYVYNVPMIQ